MKPKIHFFAFIAVFFITTTALSQQWNPRHPGWTDSFKANGFCWCNSSNFDHGIGITTVSINGTDYKIIDICDELKKHPLYRAYQNGDAPYNDIQCGNGPANDAPDETGCPGRTDIGPSGCNEIGPKWDMEWLKTRPRFGGNDGGGDNNGPDISFTTPVNNASYLAPATIKVIINATDTDGVGNVRLYINDTFIRQENVNPYEWNQNNQDDQLKNLTSGNYTLKAEAIDQKGNITTKTIAIDVNQDGGNTDGKVTFLGQSINKYISSESGSRSMRANRNTFGEQEQFIVESSGDGSISIKGNNGKYVSSENGNKAMNCNRNAIGAWEKFRLESLGGDLYAIKGNNGKYVSHENGRDMGVFCNRSRIGSWEKFIIKGLNENVPIALKINQELPLEKEIHLFPNPATIDQFTIQVTTLYEEKASIEIIDLNGKTIASKNLGIIKSGTQNIRINDLKNLVTTRGLFVARVTLGADTFVKQLIIK
ncbi:Ig-like domain-containing protein [Aquimarina sp. AU474]|uniref:Ig-like domain-containing protein n=1 Tax=Aquimarina sp. AU474 TaxID=2108529 RepID=UPI000D68ED41|nr:Ig-like domain-containing protein [Aquimarina sp. AU474]